MRLKDLFGLLVMACLSLCFLGAFDVGFASAACRQSQGKGLFGLRQGSGLFGFGLFQRAERTVTAMQRSAVPTYRVVDESPAALATHLASHRSVRAGISCPSVR